MALSPPVAVRSGRYVDAFDAAWKDGAPPDLAAAVADLPAGSRELRRILEQLIPIDLEYRWKQLAAKRLSAPPDSAALTAPNPKRIEEYVAEFPDLSASKPLNLDLVVAEFDYRLRYDVPAPSLGEYKLRFPTRWAELQSRLESIRGAA